MTAGDDWGYEELRAEIDRLNAEAEIQQRESEARSYAASENAARAGVAENALARLEAAVHQAIMELDSGFVGSRYRLGPIIDRLRAALPEPKGGELRSGS